MTCAIAREFALDRALGRFEPLLQAAHGRGGSDERADTLSRLHEPGSGSGAVLGLSRAVTSRQQVVCPSSCPPSPPHLPSPVSRSVTGSESEFAVGGSAVRCRGGLRLLRHRGWLCLCSSAVGTRLLGSCHAGRHAKRPLIK